MSRTLFHSPKYIPAIEFRLACENTRHPDKHYVSNIPKPSQDITIWAVLSETVPLSMRRMCRFNHAAHAQSIIRVFTLHLKHTIVSSDSVCG